MTPDLNTFLMNLIAERESLEIQYDPGDNALMIVIPLSDKRGVNA